MPSIFNNRIRQLILLLIIILLFILLLKQAYIFLPGFMGAITLYILLSKWYFHLTMVNKRSRTGIALIFIFLSLLIIALPVYFSIDLLSNKISAILNDPVELLFNAKLVGQKIYTLTGYNIFTDENLAAMHYQATKLVPTLINSSASIISNFAIMFFLLYFMLKNGQDIEIFLRQFIPLEEENVELLAAETRNMIKANAIGIPILACLQGIVAIIGYWIFGIKDFVLWGFITGVFSLVPIVGTASIWVPMVLYLFALNKNIQATGLLIYSAVLITNIDYVARLTLLKRFMNIHPLITVFGVIIGLGLFGFWGVIFGPLLISYFIILVKIYIKEFGNEDPSSN